ncbi:hypothetical protein AKJ52_00255 [candidate division MSBL1 archaeon SCGC-AAA382C18]|uniref:NADH-quinone oxidoreductase subunit D domain-containing protein n=1 Tax=candidate division MSBL1 archaeon SCGC-AAA382C18 TaxID=1698281 RepID=A0A133VLS9_9EURY|nr:hypothetical protein AKJ52_00255 [candidate division MSBL1 archaeon SCGC-AAA382C18]
MSFVVPVGPQHPALEEPEHFRITVEGEEIVDVNFRLGYMHRGIEKAFEEKNFDRALYLAERICGICSGIHTVASVETIEQLADIEAPRRAKYIRTMVAELERVHSHLLWAGIAAHEIGFMTLFQLVWRDRERVMDVLEMLSGNRVQYSANKIGGVRFDVKPKHLDKITNVLNQLEEDTHHYIDVFTSDETVIARVQGEGVLSKKKAKELSAVGPTARASGVDFDVRRDDPYCAYDEIDVDVKVAEAGDVLANAKVRLLETLESIRILREAVDRMPQGKIAVQPPKEFPEAQATNRVEAPRGELVYHFKSDGGEHPFRGKVRAPTLGNIPPIVEKLKGETVAEVPIVVASIDPCFCCTERVQVVDKDTGESKIVTKEEMREMRE